MASGTSGGTARASTSVVRTGANSENTHRRWDDSHSCVPVTFTVAGLHREQNVERLDDVLGIGQGAEEPVGDIDQLAALAHARAQGRIEPVVRRPRFGGHDVADLPLSHLPSPGRRDSLLECEVGASPHIPWGHVVVSLEGAAVRHPSEPQDPRRKESIMESVNVASAQCRKRRATDRGRDSRRARRCDTGAGAVRVGR
jgi:hypothetical protein